MAEPGNFDEYVTVKCNDCGELHGFFPMRVTYCGECKCGNRDFGSPRHWWDDDFGNFTLVKREDWILQ